MRHTQHLIDVARRLVDQYHDELLTGRAWIGGTGVPDDTGEIYVGRCNSGKGPCVEAVIDAAPPCESIAINYRRYSDGTERVRFECTNVGVIARANAEQGIEDGHRESSHWNQGYLKRVARECNERRDT